MKKLERSLLAVALTMAAPVWSGESESLAAISSMSNKTPLSEQISTIDLLNALEKAKLDYLKTKKETLLLERDIERMTRKPSEPDTEPKPPKKTKPPKRAFDSSAIGPGGSPRVPIAPSAIGGLVLEGINRTGRVYEARLRHGGQVLYLKVGDRLGRWRLKKITATEVVFAGPGGRIHRIGYRDGSGVPPAPGPGGIDASALESLLR